MFATATKMFLFKLADWGQIAFDVWSQLAPEADNIDNYIYYLRRFGRDIESGLQQRGEDLRQIHDDLANFLSGRYFLNRATT